MKFRTFLIAALAIGLIAALAVDSKSVKGNSSIFRIFCNKYAAIIWASSIAIRALAYCAEDHSPGPTSSR